jgi:hypothetical protein
MFPYADHRPTGSTQRSVCLAIPGLVGREFGPPIISIASWDPVAARTAMPEASINEHRNTSITEDEVRPSWQGDMAMPSSQPMFPKQLDQSQFG